MLGLAIFGLATASAFTGAAIYITTSEQPARLGLDDKSMLMQWLPSYAKGLEMQASLAMISGLIGIAVYFLDRDLWALAGGVLIISNWPYTFIVILPVNKALGAIPIDSAGPQSTTLIKKWGRLHAVRGLLGLASVIAYIGSLWILVNR